MEMLPVKHCFSMTHPDAAFCVCVFAIPSATTFKKSEVETTNAAHHARSWIRPNRRWPLSHLLMNTCVRFNFDASLINRVGRSINADALSQHHLYLRICCDEISATDAALIGVIDLDDFEVDIETVEQCAQLLLEHWPQLKKVTESPIADASAEACGTVNV